MRMLQSSGDLNFPQEALRAQSCGKLRAEDLHGYCAIVLEIPGKVDRGHPATTKLTFNSVVLGKGGLQAIEEIAHAGQDMLWEVRGPETDYRCARRVLRGTSDSLGLTLV